MPSLIGQKIAYARSKQDISQSALARMLGIVAQAHISNVEAGRRKPSLEFIVRCAELLGVSVEYLLRDSIPVEAYDEWPVAATDNTEVMRYFGVKLRHQRESRGWSQSDLARTLNSVTQVQISRLEAGERYPSISLIVDLADFFRVGIDYWVRDSIPVRENDSSQNSCAMK
jgi:transcriptional regulator with XRE-family HTH domain